MTRNQRRKNERYLKKVEIFEKHCKRKQDAMNVHLEKYAEFTGRELATIQELIKKLQ